MEENPSQIEKKIVIINALIPAVVVFQFLFHYYFMLLGEILEFKK